MPLDLLVAQIQPPGSDPGTVWIQLIALLMAIVGAVNGWSAYCTLKFNAAQKEREQNRDAAARMAEQRRTDSELVIDRKRTAEAALLQRAVNALHDDRDATCPDPATIADALAVRARADDALARRPATTPRAAP